MNLKDTFCAACGWSGDPAKVRVKSEHVKRKGCPECGAQDVVPMASRTRLARPELVIQPNDPVVSKILAQIRKAQLQPK